MTHFSPTETTSDKKGTGMKAEVFLPEDYTPAEDEPFMNERQLEWFRRELIRQKNELMSESRSTIAGLQDGTRNIPDIADRASEETDRALELRIRDRQRKLVAKIDSALRRIEDGGVRLLPRDGRADLSQAAGGAAHHDAEPRGAGTP